ncbi:adenylate cyclase type 9 [Protopterus annectens]|uniref:adenylate cyclase type 9 n=1 Tax=Protopterus annectens TaxID=7888 RepID=UPI001CFB813D|nr:adenylate cyclase type 9 [Protopterus annectens]
MASPQHQQLLPQSTEVSCDASGDCSSVTVKICKHPTPGSSSSKHCKYSISSSCSSGESAVRRGGYTGVRRRKKLPQLFERASRKWWNPMFDSSILEEACNERCFPQTQRRFRYALFYLIVASLLWSIFFGLHMTSRQIAFLVPTLCFLLVCSALFIFTYTKLYASHYVWVSLFLTVLAFALTLAPQFQNISHISNCTGLNSAQPLNYTEAFLSPVGSFSICVEVLLLLYTVMQIPLYFCVFLGLLYSVLFETFGYYFQDAGCLIPWKVVGRASLHLCIHLIGILLFIMSEVRLRTTFLKIGQSIMHGKDLEVEKALKERMIHSVMPRMIADDLLKPGDDDSDSTAKRPSTSSPKGKNKKSSSAKAPIVFRPFTMLRMEPVSILFADIVGFTKMSANKSAHALVSLLNDLFGRFDRLCEDSKCEKISTLGDCYYCVAGCPEPRPDHAYCCIEMGLGMIKAIEQFCQEKKEMVNMRVGVHTGTVLCGILGMKRFKFDVWSNDVNLANLMEQLGVAGKVHISSTTAEYLDDRYVIEDSRIVERVGQTVVDEQLKGMKTYLISGRKCMCSWLVQPGQETGDVPSVFSPPKSSGDNLENSLQVTSLPENTKIHCPVCSVRMPSCDVIMEESTTQNGCQEERKSNMKAFGGNNPKTQNGLLSPPQDEKLTNSQTSLYEMLQEKGRWAGVSLDQSAFLPLRHKTIREKTDAHFVDVIKEDSLMKDYFFNPPINKLSLKFMDSELETSYRASYQQEVVKNVPVKTFASSIFSSFLDVLLSTLVIFFLSITCFLNQSFTTFPPPPAAIIVCVIAFVLEVLSLIVSIRMVFYLDEVLDCTKNLLKFISDWLPRHFIGAILISLPAVVALFHFSREIASDERHNLLLCCAVIIAIVQYCNFCQLNSWMRSAFATLVGAVLLGLLYSFQFSRENLFNSSVPDADGRTGGIIYWELVLAFFLLLLLVWFLNREFEVSYRLHYHGNVQADLHRTTIQSLRDQADWLLRNIIPFHVAEQLKVSQSYSKNHDNVGVIFASIVNFSEFYEENFEGGKECYRVLNELIGDFDELLSKPPYSNIEKIKTIGATYMAASGLSASHCQDSSHPHSHLQNLFDFAREMMRVVDNFNKDMLWFNFKLRIGFNHGPLTAGVIGTTKLLYDIWGDTVNIASRMDTTGVECRIQVSEESYRVLREMGYEFDYRGTVNVKGKGQMKTFLFPKSIDNGIVPHHQLSISPDIRIQVDGSIGRSPTDEIASMVPSVQNTEQTVQCPDIMEAKILPVASKKLKSNSVKVEDRHTSTTKNTEGHSKEVDGTDRLSHAQTSKHL